MHYRNLRLFAEPNKTLDLLNPTKCVRQKLTLLLILIWCIKQRTNNVFYELFTKMRRFSNSKSSVSSFSCWVQTPLHHTSLQNKWTSARFHNIKCLRHCSSFLSTAIPKWAINKSAAILHFMNLFQWLIFCSFNIKRWMQVNVENIDVMFHTVSSTFTLSLAK